jgi:hypothetical protein
MNKRKKINPYTITEDSISEEDRKKLEDAMAEISALLTEVNNGPSTKKTLKNSMSADTKPFFDAALKLMALNKKIYFTTKGYVNEQYEISIEERIAHIKWCLKLFDFSSNQYLMDKTVLLQVPETLRKLKNQHGSNFPKWRDEVLDVQTQSQMMGATLNELSETYVQIAEAAEKMLPKPKTKNYDSLEDLKELKKQMATEPSCINCGKTNFRPVEGQKHCFECKDCGRANWFYADKK